MNKRLEKVQDIVRLTATWRYTPIVLLGVSLLDFFVLWVPSDAFLIAALLGNPHRVRVFVLSMVLGRMVGTSVAYWAAADTSLEKITSWAMMYHLESAWEKSQFFFENFGPLSLGLTALTPFPMLFVVLLSAASGASIFPLVAFATLGSGLRYTLISIGVLGGIKWFSKKHSTS